MVSVAMLKTQLQIQGVEQDELLGELSGVAERFVTEFCGGRFAPGTHLERHPGGGKYLFLAHYPASTVSVAGVDPAKYSLHGDRGVVEMLPEFGHFPPGELAVTVTVPDGARPAAVDRACIQLVAHWLGQPSAVPGGAPAVPTGGVPHGVISLLKSARAPALG